MKKVNDYVELKPFRQKWLTPAFLHSSPKVILYGEGTDQLAQLEHPLGGSMGCVRNRTGRHAINVVRIDGKWYWELEPLKKVTDIMDMWESLIKEDTTPEEKMYLIDQSCKVSSKMIALQQMGHEYQEAVDILHVNESKKIHSYVLTGGKYKFDDDICYMYPNMEKVTIPDIKIDDFFYIDDKIVLSNN